MPDSAQVRSAVDAAEQAATAGDFSAAARHLRDALALQERELGPTHPDVASTLNNLGVVSERIGDFAEAERCYRRAYEIVTAAFPADHPFVETSRQNLAAFCAARSLPFETTPKAAAEAEAPRPAVAVAAEPAAKPKPAPVSAPRAESPLAPPSPARAAVPAATATVESTPRRIPFVPVVVAAVLIVGLLWWFNRGRSAETTAAPDGKVSAAPAPTPATAEPVAVSMPPPTPAAAPASKAAVEPPPAAPAARKTPSRDESLSVVDAQLCRTLTRAAEWTCARASDPVVPGHVYFYTRLTTPHDTTIVHRWYRDDRVQLNRELQIDANTSAGYRTYSHLVIDAKASGQWRVELRTLDGRVLREERFVVR